MMKYLITGGSGVLGSALVKAIAHDIRVFDIDEAGLAMLPDWVDRVRGDVSDIRTVELAMQDVDVCIHAASLKNISITERNLRETVKTNIIGTMNVIEAAIDGGVRRCILISTDKAVNPTSAYGASKAMMEKMFLAANSHHEGTWFSVLRPGNFNVRAGGKNVFDLWNSQKSRGEAPVFTTDERMKRYFIDLRNVVSLVLDMSTWKEGGLIVVPKMQMYKMADIFKHRHPNGVFTNNGLRPGEKLVEELITSTEQAVAEEKRNYWVIR